MPETWLALLALVQALALIDTQRDPDRQRLSRAYVAAVGVYQSVGRPLLKGRVQCRFRPTCSVYSRDAVRKYGILTGLRLTISRIRSCRVGVPLGTYQPVP